MNNFILADCNNFYVSCERLLNPALEDKAVIVLSNNDGCVVSRSQEAKNLGIKMGEPYFKIREFCERAKVVVYSSNYELYGDISARVMNIYAEMCPEIEIYSIDEAFLKYPSMSPSEIMLIAQDLRKTIKRWVGIPICLGIAPTKTLSKVANDLAKKNKSIALDLSSPEVREKVFNTYFIGDVWGIGSQLTKKLNALGIYTVADFLRTDPLLIRKKMGVVGERLQLELQGVCCLDLEEATAKKSITRSRSFGKAITNETEIAEALSTYVASGCETLREQKSLATSIYVFLEVAAENSVEFQRFQLSTHANLDMATNDTSEIITAAKRCLKNIYQPHRRYRKCGIIFLDLIAEKDLVLDLFAKPNPKRKLLMHTMDELNRTLGKNKVFLGAMGMSPTWKGRKELHSHHSTANWQRLPLVQA